MELHRSSLLQYLFGWRYLLGFIGIILLVVNSGGELLHVSAAWIAYLVLGVASLCWAVGALYSSRANLPSAPLMSAAIQMLTEGFGRWLANK